MTRRLSSTVTLAISVVPIAASAAPLGRVALWNAGQARWSRADERGRMIASRQGIGSNEVFALADAGRGEVSIRRAFEPKFVQVATRAPFLVSATASSARAKTARFQLVPVAPGLVALKSASSGKFVCVGKDGLWAADGTSAAAPQANFRLDPCSVDVWQALTAFATLSPGKVKLKSSLNPPGNVRLTAETLRGPYHYWYQAIEDYTHDPIGHPVYDKNALRFLGDWECWVIYGTLPQFIPGLTWTEGIPRTRRFCDPMAQEDSPHQTVNWYEIKMDGTAGTHNVGDEWGRRYVSWEQDLSVGRGNSQVNMGRRWVLRTSYKDNPESWIIDLGPRIGTFDPRYGTVGYVNDKGVFLWFNNVQDAFDINPPRVKDY